MSCLSWAVLSILAARGIMFNMKFPPYIRMSVYEVVEYLDLFIYLFIRNIMTTYIHIQYHKTEHDYIHTCKNISEYLFLRIK